MEQCLEKNEKQQKEEENNNGQLQKLECIEEEGGGPAEKWPPTTVRPPETPTETMEFLARSWSLSAVEISKALKVLSSKGVSDAAVASAKKEQRSPPPPLDASMATAQAGDGGGGETSPPFSPRANLDAQLLRAAAGRGGKTVGILAEDRNLLSRDMKKWMHILLSTDPTPGELSPPAGIAPLCADQAF